MSLVEGRRQSGRLSTEDIPTPGRAVPNPPADVESSLANLSIAAKKHTPKTTVSHVADSWDDSFEEETSELETECSNHYDLSGAPSPTPLPPTSANTCSSEAVFDDPYGSMRDGGGSASQPKERVRPDKQTATASRLIAGALGVRAPKRTEEQKAYDKAMKEKEQRKREDRIREEAEARKAKEAVWDD